MQAHCMIIVQVFRRLENFFVRRGIAGAATRATVAFRMAMRFSRKALGQGTGRSGAANFAAHHRRIEGPFGCAGKIALSHLGRTRIQCL